MQLLKFSKILFFIIISMNLFASAEKECLNSSFDITVSHKGQPFGLLPNILTISKNNCSIIITHQKMKYINKKWDIDVCREPVHIKSGSGAVDVLKRLGNCQNTKDEFCSKYSDLIQVLQDDGLIFAEGEKENLSSDHGRVFCAYQLAKYYLGAGTVLSRHETGALNFKVETSNLKSDDSTISPEKPDNAPRPVMEGQEETSNQSSSEAPLSNTGSF